MRTKLFRELTAALMVAVMLLQSVQAAAPGWWSTQGVLNPQKAPDDHAALNQGQLKNFVRAAIYELHAKLPGGAGGALNQMLQTWRTQKLGADDHVVVTLGQLKAVAQPVYESMQAAHLPLNVPWTAATGDDDDHAVANLGQAKRVFAFVVPDLVTLGLRDSDADGFSDALEIAMGTNPFAAASHPGVVGDLSWLLANGFGSFGGGGGNGGGVGGGGLPPYVDPYPEPWPDFDSADSSAPDPDQDTDEDGVPDAQDAVPYDPSLKFAKTGVPFYAVLDLGVVDDDWSDGFIDMADNGAMVWRRKSHGTYDELAVWRPSSPQPAEIVFQINTSGPEDSWNAGIRNIGEDGLLFGWATFVMAHGMTSGRPFALAPDSGTATWLPEVLLDEGDYQNAGGNIGDAQDFYGWGLQRQWGGPSQSGPGGKFFGTVINGIWDEHADYPGLDYYSERDWIAFYRVSAAGAVLENAAPMQDFPPLPEPPTELEYDENGNVTNFPEAGTREALGTGTMHYRYSGAASRSGCLRTTRTQRLPLYQLSTGGNWLYDADIDPLTGPLLLEDVFATRLHLSNEQSFELDAGDLLAASPAASPVFHCVSAAAQPWVGGQLVHQDNWWESKACLWKPAADGTAYERHFLYANAADHAAGVPLFNVSAIAAQGHALVRGYLNDGEWDDGLWVDGEAQPLRQLIGGYERYLEYDWRYYDMSAEGMIAASAAVLNENDEYERHLLVLIPLSTHAILADGSISPLHGGVQASLPSPVFCDQVEDDGQPAGDAFCELRNPRLLPDGSLVGDVYLKGELGSRACDFFTGEKGSITTAQLWVNGADTPQAEFTVEADKQGGGTRTRPYPYKGSFETTVPNVPLTPGMNTFKITAQDAVYALPGYSTWGVTVTVEDSSEGDGGGGGGSVTGSLRLEVRLPGPTLDSSAADTVQAALDLNGQTAVMSLVETASMSGVFTGTAGGQPVRLSLVDVNALSAGNRDQLTALVLLGAPGGAQSWQVGLQETGAASGVLQGGWTSSGGGSGGTGGGGSASGSSTTNTGGTTGGAGGVPAPANGGGAGGNGGGGAGGNVPAAPPPVVKADSVAAFLGKSNGGEFHPYVMGVGVPQEMLGHFEMAFDDETFKLMRDAETGMMMLEDPENPGKPFCPSFAPHATDDNEPGDDDEEHAKRMAVMAKRFAKGFACGIGYGGVDMVTSTGKAVWGAAKFGGRALMQVGLTFKWAGELITGQSTTQTQRMLLAIDDQQREVVGQGLQVGKFLGTLLLDTAAIFPKIEVGLLTGNMDMVRTALHGSETHRMIFSMASEAITATMNDLRTGKPGQQGYVIGKIVFEVASIILPQTKLGKIAEVTKSQVLARLIGKSNVLPPGAKQVAGEIKDVVDASQMCFVAGTLILTKSGWMRIEDIRVGMWVWSRDEHSGATGWKRVRHTFTTHPREIYHLTYELRGPPESGLPGGPLSPISESETLGVTAPHPFWVRNREQPAFIEAEKLQAGDELLTAFGSNAVVLSKVLEHAPAGKTFTTYNFEVEDYHTYFAGRSAVWVHNHLLPGMPACMRASAGIHSLTKNGHNTWDAFKGELALYSYEELSSRARLRVFNEVRKEYLANNWTGGTPPWEMVSAQRNISLVKGGQTDPIEWARQVAGEAGNSDKLGKNLKATGIEAPWGEETAAKARAHHIVMGGSNYDSAKQAREILADAGIDINEAANGVFLPSSAEFIDLGKAIHNGYHPEKYSDWVLRRLEPLEGNAAALREELQNIAVDLVEKGWPP